MERNEFYRTLSRLKKQYNWEISEDNTIVATGTGQRRSTVTYNPVTAVANWHGYRPSSNNKRETLKLGRALGLNRDFVEHVYDATTSVSNRGNAQVVRGKLRSALEI